jgi:hypothetical protein
MNNRSDQRPLLDDVLAEASPPDFRAALLGETLRLARQRRRRRQTRRAGGVLAGLLFAAWFAWQNHSVQPAAGRMAAKIPAVKNYQLVETQPLPAGAAVATKDFAEVKMISSAAAVTTIATSGGGFRFINDEQLLALAGPRPALLIRTGPDSEELVFADSAALPKEHRAN